MKKAIKKLMAALLAVAMLCAMAVPAFADGNDETGTITIENAVKGQTYDVYQMFVLNSYSSDSASYTYTVNPAWANFFAEGAEGANYITLNNGHPTWKEGVPNSADNAGVFAKAAIAWAKQNNVSVTKTQKASDDGKLVIGSLQLGYYLVDTSLGSLCSLNTTAPNATVSEKNDKPSIDKKVEEGTNTWGTESHAKIGDTVNYKVTVTVKTGKTGYVVRDTMTDGLTFNKDSIKVDNAELTSTIGTLQQNVEKEDGSKYTFTLTFADSYILAHQNQTITVTYSATVNEKAVIDGDGNINKVDLKYGNSSETVEEETKTYVHQFDLVKYDGTTNKLLAGAKFKLYDSETDGTEIKLVKESDSIYRVATADEEGVEIVTIGTAPILIKGLDNKVYYLEETEAPKGYNKVEDRTPVDLIAKSQIVNATITADTVYNTSMGGVAIANNAGATLPSTGGMGTTIFYVVGGGLMIAAVVLLVTKKRMENK